MASVPQRNYITDFESSLSRIDELVKNRQENSNKLIQFIISNIDDINNQIKSLESLSGNIAGQFSQLKVNLQNCEEVRSDQQRLIDECHRDLDALSKEKTIIENELKELRNKSQDELLAKQSQIDSLEGEIRNLESLIDPLKKQVSDLSQEIGELKMQNEDKEKRIAEIAEKDKLLQDLNNELQAAQARIQEITGDVDKKNAEVENLSSQHSNSNEKVKQLEEQLAEINKQEEGKNQQLASLQNENDDLISRIKAATVVINNAMQLLDELRTTKREEEKAELLKRFKSTSSTIEQISNSLQGIQRGGKKYKKYKTQKKN